MGGSKWKGGWDTTWSCIQLRINCQKELLTASEIENAINGLANGKASGNDATPPEVIKQGIPVLLSHLHELLSLCWRGEVPQDMRNAKIVALFKNKGDRSGRNNYGGISLLSVVGKVFARVVLARLQILADRIYSES